MAIKRSSKISTSFSAASMTDMIFLLLMFLLIATTLVSPNALRLTLPKSNNQLAEKAYTTVSITADLKYYVETEQVTPETLESVLQAKTAGQEQPTISLHCDKSVPIDEVVRVMNIARNNNFRLILATSPE